MNTADEELIRLLKERAAHPEPTATEAAAYVGTKVAEWGCYIVIAIAIAGFWIGTP